MQAKYTILIDVSIPISLFTITLYNNEYRNSSVVAAKNPVPGGPDTGGCKIPKID